MQRMAWWQKRWSGAVLVLIILTAMAWAAGWVFLVPIFQSPDEDQHFDYALALYQHGRLFLLRDRPDCVLGLIHPYTNYLVKRTRTRSLPFHLDQKMPADYGSATYFAKLNNDRPANTSLPRGRIPSLAWVYPCGYYALLAAWIDVLFRIRDDLIWVLFGCRFLSVALLAVSLAASYGTLREMGHRLGFALWFTTIIGFFPLTSFVASYVQPDNLSFALISLILYLTLRARRANASEGVFLALGLALGALLLTKIHFFLVTVLPALAALAPAIRRHRLRILTLVLPTAFAYALHLWTVWGGNNYYSAASPNAENWTYWATGFARAFQDFFMGTTHHSFWGTFGWLDTPLVFGTVTLTKIIHGALRATTLTVLMLTLLRLSRWGRVVRRLLLLGRRKTVVRFLVANPMFNSFMLFTLLMFALYVHTDNRFGAQGRNWLPLLLPIFWTGICYAPRALPCRWRSRAQSTLMIGLTLYTVLGAVFAVISVHHRFYAS